MADLSGGPGASCAKSRLVGPWSKASLTFHVSFDIFRQFSGVFALCLRLVVSLICNQKGVESPTGEKVSFFEFPKQPLIKKQWIHAIRRDEGKNWQITRTTKVCSLHFRSKDLRKSLNGRLYVIANGVPSRFAWSVPSPRKRKAPTERTPLPSSSRAKKQLIRPDKISETETPQAIPQDSQCKTTSTNSESRNINETWNPVEERKQIEDLEVKLLQAQGELTNLHEGHSELKRKLAERERQLEAVSSRLFSLDRFRSDVDINFYTGLPSYATFMCILIFWILARMVKTFVLESARTSQRSSTIQTPMKRKTCKKPREDVAENLG